MSAPQNNSGYLGYSYCCWANWTNSSLANWSEPPQCFTLKVFTLKVSLSTFFFRFWNVASCQPKHICAFANPNCATRCAWLLSCVRFSCLTFESGSTLRIIRRLGNHSQTLLFPCRSMLATERGPIAELMFACSAVYTLFTLCVCWCEGQMFTFWHGTGVTQTKTGRSTKTHKSQRREKANRRPVEKLFVELLE